MAQRIDRVVITGAGSGIGLDLARRFLAEGSSLVLNGRDKGKLERAAAALGADRQTLEVRHFASVRVVPVVRADHPLARAGTPAPEALREHAQIILRDSALGESSASLNVLLGGLRWSVTDVAAKKELIAAGMGWGGLPEHAVADELASGALVALDVPEFEADKMELFVMRRRDRVRGVVMQALWQELTVR